MFITGGGATETLLIITKSTVVIPWYSDGTIWYFDVYYGTLLNDYSAIYHNTCLKSLHHFGIISRKHGKTMGHVQKKKKVLPFARFQIK